MAAEKAGYRNSEVKGRIFERASSSVIDTGKVAQSIVKNSKSKDIIHQATKTFIGLDNTLASTDQNIVHIDKARRRMEFQYMDLEKGLQHIENMTRSLHEI